MKEDSVLAPVVAIGLQPELLASQQMEGVISKQSSPASVRRAVDGKTLTASPGRYASRNFRFSLRMACSRRAVVRRSADLGRVITSLTGPVDVLGSVSAGDRRGSESGRDSPDGWLGRTETLCIS